VSILGKVNAPNPLPALWSNLSKRFPVIPLGWAFRLCYGISILALTAGIFARLFWKQDSGPEVVALALGAGATGVSLAALLIINKLIYHDWIFVNTLAQAYSLRARDRKGRRMPGSILRERLKPRDFDEMTKDLPDDFLLALHTAKILPMSDDLIVKHLSAEPPSGHLQPVGNVSMSKHPAFTILTRIDFANDNNEAVRRAAAAWLPKSLWLRAAKTLLQSKYPEARMAAVQSATIPRLEIFTACKNDADQTVRATAWARLKADLSETEAGELSYSQYKEIRLQAIESQPLSRPRLIQLCRDDKEPAIRKAAWEQLQ